MAGPFILSDQPITRWRKVEVRVPTDRGFATQILDLRMVACTNTELEELRNQSIGLSETQDNDLGATFLIERVRDWRGVKIEGDDGKPVDMDFSEDRLRQMLDIPYVMTAVLRAYTEFASGARVKN